MIAVDLPAVPRVLIAEADPWSRDLLKQVLLNVRCDARLDVCADGQQADHVALLAEDGQAAGILIQWQHQVLLKQMSLQGLDLAGIVIPVGAGQERAPSTFGIHADWRVGRLVQQQCHWWYFFCRGTGLQRDVLFRSHLDEWRFDQFAVNGYPATLDVQLRFAPGAAELFGEAFGKAYGIGHGALGTGNGRGRKVERGEPGIQRLAEGGSSSDHHFLLMVICRDGPWVWPLTPLGMV